MNPDAERFIAFLARLASGAATREVWQEVAVIHYPEPRIEEARRRLVAVALAGGDWSWPNPPSTLRHVARELRADLVSGESTPVD